MLSLVDCNLNTCIRWTVVSSVFSGLPLCFTAHIFHSAVACSLRRSSHHPWSTAMHNGWKGHTSRRSPGAHRRGKLSLCCPQSLHCSLVYRTLFIHMVWKLLCLFCIMSAEESDLSQNLWTYNFCSFLVGKDHIFTGFTFATDLNSKHVYNK